jgi:hypothetical protein
LDLFRPWYAVFLFTLDGLGRHLLAIDAKLPDPSARYTPSAQNNPKQQARFRDFYSCISRFHRFIIPIPPPIVNIRIGFGSGTVFLQLPHEVEVTQINLCLVGITISASDDAENRIETRMASEVV